VFIYMEMCWVMLYIWVSSSRGLAVEWDKIGGESLLVQCPSGTRIETSWLGFSRVVNAMGKERIE
jgi:hypothetical protein